MTKGVYSTKMELIPIKMILFSQPFNVLRDLNFAQNRIAVHFPTLLKYHYTKIKVFFRNDLNPRVGNNNYCFVLILLFQVNSIYTPSQRLNAVGVKRNRLQN